MDEHDVVVIGGSQAGICASGALQARDIDHVVLEREERPFWNFRNTWDAFRMNTPNFMNALPGHPEPFAPDLPRDEIARRDDVVAYLEHYAKHVDPPLRTGVDVQRVVPEGEGWRVEADEGVWQARAVVCCVGISGQPWSPDIALPDELPSMHVQEYRRPDDLPTDRVVVVGSGASGTQIARDLAEAGREVVLACSDVAIVPLKVFGISPMRLLRPLFDLGHRDNWLGRRLYEKFATGGQGTVEPGPKQLARDYGVRLVGRLQEVEDGELCFDDDSRVPVADTSVVWCTGYRYDFSFLEEAGVAPHEEPDHHRGVHQTLSGLYFVGLKFQWRFSSHLIGGVGNDAEYVADQVVEQLASERAA